MLDFIDKPINPPGPYRFTVISTFAGCGGSSLGYKWAGGKVLAAVEWDQNAVDTYRLNHEGTLVLHRDIATVTVEELLSLTGLAAGELDIFDGSPPCQGFSTAGKRDMGDSRNQLFHEYARLLRGLRPKVFVMENVSGMVKGKMKLIFAEVLRVLKGCGYRVSARLMNAMYFGVPQSRERMIFIGVREDLRIEPSHPAAQMRPIAMAKVLPISRATYDTKGAFSKRLFNPKTDVFPTITKGNQYHIVCSIQGAPAQHLSVAQAQIFASYPGTFKFAGADGRGWARIGNSVPPRFMQAIAEHIRDHILTETGQQAQKAEAAS